MVKSAP